MKIKIPLDCSFVSCARVREAAGMDWADWEGPTASQPPGPAPAAAPQGYSSNFLVFFHPFSQRNCLRLTPSQKQVLYFSFLIVSMQLMELYLQHFIIFFFFFFFFRIHDFKKPYITSFNNNKKKALIQKKDAQKVCRPRLIAENRERIRGTKTPQRKRRAREAAAPPSPALPAPRGSCHHLSIL